MRCYEKNIDAFAYTAAISTGGARARDNDLFTIGFE